MSTYTLIERHDAKLGGGWYATVEVNGKRYFCGIERGKVVRIAFKPRGQNKGFHWTGFVRSASGKTIWSGRVGKSNGIRGLLKAAGLVSSEQAATP